MILIVVLICIPLVISDIGHIFVHLLAVCISSFRKYLFKSTPHFKLYYLYFIAQLILVAYYIYIYFFLDINPLLDVQLANVFSHSVGCLFILLTGSFAIQKFLSLMQTHFKILVLISCASVVLHPRSLCQFQCFVVWSLRNLKVSGLRFRALIILSWFFV